MVWLHGSPLSWTMGKKKKSSLRKKITLDCLDLIIVPKLSYVSASELHLKVKKGMRGNANVLGNPHEDETFQK